MQKMKLCEREYIYKRFELKQNLLYCLKPVLLTPMKSENERQIRPKLMSENIEGGTAIYV